MEGGLAPKYRFATVQKMVVGPPMKTKPGKIYQTALLYWVREDLVLNGTGTRDGQPFQVTRGELNASKPPMRCQEFHTDLKTRISVGRPSGRDLNACSITKTKGTINDESRRNLKDSKVQILSR